MLLNKNTLCICLIGLSVFLNSCAYFKDAEAVSVPDENVSLSMEDAPEIKYDIPVSTPHILTDMLGYMPSQEKTVLLFGENLPEHFGIYRASDDEMVFEADIINKGFSEKYNTNIAIGYFSEFTDLGEYYIAADYLGKSYAFSIKEDIYKEIFAEVLDRNNVSDKSEDIDLLYILLSYELFPSSYSAVDGNTTSEEEATGNGDTAPKGEATPDGDTLPKIIVDMRSRTDYLISNQDESGLIGSKKTTAESAALLVKYGYLTNEYDPKYSMQCYKAAESAWKYLQNEDEISIDEQYLLSAELYRALGASSYSNFLESYLKQERYGELNSYKTLLGSITYINTARKVNKTYCEGIMKKLMQRAEEAASKSRESFLMVSSEDDSKLMDDLTVMTLVDHIIPNYEYNNIILNYLHFLSGRNFDSGNYLTESDDIRDSRLIFALSRIVSNDGFTKE